MARAWGWIVAAGGLVRVEALAAEVGWRRKRPWSRFRSQIGRPPERAAKPARFDHAAHRLAAGDDTARAAADSDYADRSHLHRDVMACSGVTPATVAAHPCLAADSLAWRHASRGGNLPWHAHAAGTRAPGPGRGPAGAGPRKPSNRVRAHARRPHAPPPGRSAPGGPQIRW